eukprot:1417739-Ditylum_brightwellii.AAC.1
MKLINNIQESLAQTNCAVVSPANIIINSSETQKEQISEITPQAQDTTPVDQENSENQTSIDSPITNRQLGVDEYIRVNDKIL